jgi:hypothetical protein
LVDIDGDGHLDILSGSYSRMEQDMAGLFQVLYGKSDGTFRKAEVLKGTDGKPLIIPTSNKDQWTDKICTRPFAVDWDGDGKLDLVVGNFSGTFYWFKGHGRGKFEPKAEQIKAGGAPLKIPGAHSDPFVIDLDGDGSLDIVSGCSDGGIYWARNKAPRGKTPDLEPFKQLIKPASADATRVPSRVLLESDVRAPKHASRVWVADINGDGKLDLIVGDSVTLTSPVKGLNDEEFEKKYTAWEKELQAAVKSLNSARDPEAQKKANEEYNKVYQKRSSFMRQEMTGFVWVYLQK